MFVLQASPQPLDKDVVDGSTLSIHAQTDVVFVDYTLGKDGSSKLTPLVGFKDFRSTVSVNCNLQYISTPFSGHCIAQRPSDYKAAVQIMAHR